MKEGKWICKHKKEKANNKTYIIEEYLPTASKGCRMDKNFILKTELNY